MRNFRFILLLAMAAVIIHARDCSGTERALRLRDGQVVGLERMIGEVRGARLIFIGEDHERKENHDAQLEIIRKLHRAGVPLAVGMEMFTAGSQGELDRWVAGELATGSFIRIYYREWRMPWPLYRDILLYARDNRIPLIGLNVPREITRKVGEEGFAALTPEERKKLPSGVTCSVDPAYREFIRRGYAQHHRNGKSFIYFCEAQMLWNKGMGEHLLGFLARNPGRTVVVLAGVGHAMKGGIPEVLRGAGYDCKVILPELPYLDRGAVTGTDADYLLLFDHVGGAPLRLDFFQTGEEK